MENWKLKTVAEQEELLREIFLVRYIFNSNSIEGINLSYNQTKEIFESESIRSYNGDVRELFSVMNSENTFDSLIKSRRENREIDSDFILELHKIAMRNSLDKERYCVKGERPGQYKIYDYVVGKHDTGSASESVEEDIEDLLELVNSAKSNNYMRIASVLHCEFEAIHPFSDGNGRVGRWLTNYYLLMHDEPMLIIFNEDKTEYYEILEYYDETNDPSRMTDFLEKQRDKTWDIRGKKRIDTTNKF